MKILFGILVFIMVTCVLGFLLPACIGILAGLVMIDAGNVLGGLGAIAVGVGINLIYLFGVANIKESPSNFEDDTCPYCGSADADGSHCYDCDQDY